MALRFSLTFSVAVTSLTLVLVRTHTHTHRPKDRQIITCGGWAFAQYTCTVYRLELSADYVCLWRVCVDKKEFCQFDSFEARCDESEAIVMESAHYGRMRSGRCISGEGYIGCSADVLTTMDSLCSGRRHCIVSVTSLTDVVQPCRRDFTSYLEATYTCKKGKAVITRSFYRQVVSDKQNCLDGAINRFNDISDVFRTWIWH